MTGQPIDPSATDEHVAWGALALLLVLVLIGAGLYGRQLVHPTDVRHCIGVGIFAVGVVVYLQDFARSVYGVVRVRRVAR